MTRAPLDRTGRREVLLLALLLACFAAVNVVTLPRYPAAWVDEIQFADPAVNAALGKGFTSTVWIAQTGGEPWAGNAPLYSLLLAGWLRLLGVSEMAVRSLNVVLMLGLGVLLWSFVRRTGLSPVGRWRLTVVALVLLAHSVTFASRMGRYDIVGMLVLLMAAHLCATRLSWRTGPPLFAVGALVAPAGLQLVPASAVLGLLWLALAGRAALARLLVLGGGVVAGGVALWAAYSWLGVWDRFVASTTAVGVIGRGLGAKLASLPSAYTNDKTFVLVLGAALLLAWPLRRSLGREWRRSPLLFGLLTALVLPAVLHVVGKFPVYYAWMALVPLAVGVGDCLATRGNDLPRSRLRIATLLLVAGMLVGLPLRLAVLASVWQERDPAELERYVSAHVDAADAVVGDFKAYYALKRHAGAYYAPTYLGVMPPEERQGVTALLVRPDAAPAIAASVGGHWVAAAPVHRAGALLPAPRALRLVSELREENYPLRLFRRVDATSP
jgi:hypothetical protein